MRILRLASFDYVSGIALCTDKIHTLPKSMRGDFVTPVFLVPPPALSQNYPGSQLRQQPQLLRRELREEFEPEIF